MGTEFLINPNIAYILLTGGILLTIMALFAPGTGILELAALFLLVLAGWEIYNLEINWWALGLLVVGVIPFLLAVRKSKNLIFLVIAIISFVIGSCYLFPGETWWKPGVNPILAVTASLFISAYLWIAVTKSLEADKIQPSHDPENLLGQIGEAKTNIHEEGSVQVAGELWSARSEQPIQVGAKVRIVDLEGLVLLVEPEA